jgi:hypothetical protein
VSVSVDLQGNDVINDDVMKAIQDLSSKFDSLQELVVTFPSISQ